MRRLFIPISLFAITGLLTGLRFVAISTLPHILSLDPGLNYQEVTDGLPVPRLLNWNLTYIDGLITLRDLGGPLLLLANLCLFGLLWIASVRLFNPSFRLFRIVQPEQSTVGDGTEREGTEREDIEGEDIEGEDIEGEGSSHPKPDQSSASLDGRIEFHSLRKTVTLVLIFGLPLMLIWLAIPASVPRSLPIETFGTWQKLGIAWLLRFIVLGEALFLGFHIEGLAGDFETASLNSNRSRWITLALQGAIWGLLVFILVRLTLPAGLEPLLTREQALGTFNITSWKEVGGHYLLCSVLVWLAAVCLLIGLGRPGLSGKARGASLSLCALAILLSAWSDHVFSFGYIASRYDLTPRVLSAISAEYRQDRPGRGIPNGQISSEELARRTGLKLGTSDQPLRNVLIVAQNDTVFNVVQNNYTLNGLLASPQSVLPAQKFLIGRRYRSGLSWAATIHLFDLCTLHFDTTSALDALLDDLSFGPHLQQAGLVTESLFFICAATKQNLALLDKWADSDRFSYPDRTAKRLIGDLYRRFGAEDRALLWYRKADMPRSFLKRIKAERPLFHTGHVSGTLRLNGRPLRGVQIGLVPWRLNGLPHNLEPYVADAMQEIFASQPTGESFAAYHPSPFAFRWISASAVTDDQGRFTIDGLTEGQYRFICTLPPDIQLIPPFDPHLRMINPPVAFSVHYGNPEVDLGIIDMFYRRRRRP